jgi:pSer/pThr/pTyr-binding forkhead associated (FHA) protein
MEGTMTQAEYPSLIISEGKYAGRRWSIEADSLIVGRDTTCDLVLAERQISRQHVRIKRVAEVYYIEDLDSKNGTWVNNQPLKGERVLKDGDEINLGQVVKIAYSESEATAPITSDAAHSSRIRLDRDSRRVFIGNKEVDPPLSLPQYRLVELLFDANGAVCTREQVVKVVWPEAISEGVSEQAIDALVRRLRDRIAEIDPDHQHIVTVRGHGFRLEGS